MASKKQQKAERAAALRRELGLEDEDGGRAESAESVSRVPVQPAGGGKAHGGSRDNDNGRVHRDAPAAAPSSGRTRKPASFEQPDVEPTPAPDRQQQANADAWDAGLTQVVGLDFKTKPSCWPKKHKVEDLKRGTSVWYRGERFWIEYCPPSWERTVSVRICDKPVYPSDKLDKAGFPMPTPSQAAKLGMTNAAAQCTSFFVHPDLLELAPQAKSMFDKQPTIAGIARKERAAKGEKDVGDDVAMMLREAKGLDDVYRIGAQYLNTTVDDLKKRYGHLNPGQQRMNVGNKMRAAWRKSKK